jgi:outer membrane protein assembly factor BamD (BamD/ComL family)
VHSRSLESSLKFAQTFPAHPESAQVLTRAATDLYSVKDYARAIAAGEALLARQPAVDQTKQRVAWTVIGNSNFDQGVFDHAEAAYGHAQLLMPANDPERGVIVERLAASIYKQGEQRAKSGDNAAAVEDFLRVAALAPGSKIRANADFDAAALLIKDKKWDRAIVVLEGFRRNFPQSPLRPMSRAIWPWPTPSRIIPARRPRSSSGLHRLPANRPKCSARPPCRRRTCTTRPATRPNRA